MKRYKINNMDVMDWAERYKGPKFHALFCDAPYHLTTITKRFGKEGSAPAKFGRDGVFQRVGKGFMGQEWDGGDISFHPETWDALGEHLFPGAFGMTFGGSRTAHRIAVAIEDAGFIIHPMIGWVYGSGFPKATRVKGHKEFDGHRYGMQALKPAMEPIIVFQKPYDDKSVQNIMDNGAGTLNIDAGRIPTQDAYVINTWDDNAHPFGNGAGNKFTGRMETKGRWPANFILDDTMAPMLDIQSGITKDGIASGNSGAMGYHHGKRGSTAEVTYGGEGGASRFFYNIQTQLDEADPFKYQKKPNGKERTVGLDEKNDHPTVKSIDLNRYLSSLLLPPVEYAPRRILVPFSGVMSEGIGALLAGWEYVEAIELGKHYCELGEKRVKYWRSKK